MADNERVSNLQVKFFTKQAKYAIPDSPYYVPSSVGIDELSSLVNGILNPDVCDDRETINFDFLVEGEFLRTNLEEYIAQNNISSESVIELEYLERQAAPEPEDSLLHDDWVASVKARNDFILCGCYDNTVRIWNTEGEALTTIPGHGSPVKCVAWINNEDEEPVKTFISGSHDESVLLWQWNQQTNCVDCLHMCRGHAGSVDCVAVDSTKTRFCGRFVYALYEQGHWCCCNVIPTSNVACAAFCSGSWDKMLKIWSARSEDDATSSGDTGGERPLKKKKVESAKVPTRVPLMTLSAHNEGVSSVQWLSDSEVCTASWDHSIKLWNLQQGTCTSTIPGSKAVFDTAYSELNQTLIAGSADRHIRLYDPRATDGSLVKSTFTSHTGWVSSVAWSQTNPYLFISGSYDNLVKLWDTRSPKAPLYDLSGHADKVLAVDWTMQQYMISGASDNTLKIFKYQEASRTEAMDQC